MKLKIPDLKRPASLLSMTLAAMLVISGPLASTLQAAKTVGGWSEVYSGVWYATGSNDSPLQKVYAVRIDTRNPSVRFKATPGNGGAAGETTRQNTLDFRYAHDLRVAVNANFYETTGSGANIQGLLISDGSLISGGSTYYPRPAQVRITSSNIVSIVNSTANPSGIHTAVAGDAFPLAGGNPQGDHSTRHPRTGLGSTQDGRYVIMLVIDGRQPGYSDGATILELGQWLKDFGAYTGVNLDGGGSSTLVSHGSVRNSPSDGYPRPVGANIGAYAADKGVAENTSMTTDASGRVWYAHVQDNGHVYTRYFDPSSNSWSGLTFHGSLPNVAQRTAPAIVGHANGDVRLFAVTTDGQMHSRVYTDSTGQWTSFTPFGGSDWSIETSPVAVLRTSGEVSMLGVTASGALKHRAWNPGTGAWGPFTEHGMPTWSPRAKPALVAGVDGRLHVLGVKGNGYIYSRIWVPGSGWSGWTDHGHGWATQGGIAAIPRSDGNITYVAIKADGTFHHRSGSLNGWWSNYGHHDTGWSTTAVPSVAWANDRLWIFGTKANNAIYHRSWQAGSGWGGWNYDGDSWSVNVGPSMIALPSGGYIWTATNNSATLRTRRLLPNTTWASYVDHGGGWVK